MYAQKHMQRSKVVEISLKVSCVCAMTFLISGWSSASQLSSWSGTFSLTYIAKDGSDPFQWHSQDITYARAQHGHTTFVVLCTKFRVKCRSFLGGSGGILPPENLGILHPPRLVLRSYCSKAYKLLTADLRMRLVILWIYIAILRRSISRPFSDQFAINNATISAALVGHGL